MVCTPSLLQASVHHGCSYGFHVFPDVLELCGKADDSVPISYSFDCVPSVLELRGVTGSSVDGAYVRNNCISGCRANPVVIWKIRRKPQRRKPCK